MYMDRLCAYCEKCVNRWPFYAFAIQVLEWLHRGTDETLAEIGGLERRRRRGARLLAGGESQAEVARRVA